MTLEDTKRLEILKRHSQDVKRRHDKLNRVSLPLAPKEREVETLPLIDDFRDDRP